MTFLFSENAARSFCGRSTPSACRFMFTAAVCHEGCAINYCILPEYYACTFLLTCWRRACVFFKSKWPLGSRKNVRTSPYAIHRPDHTNEPRRAPAKERRRLYIAGAVGPIPPSMGSLFLPYNNNIPLLLLL